MPGDRKIYRNALMKWDRLHRQKAYSVPEALGTTAVFWSHQGNGERETADAAEFHAEALIIADRLWIQGRTTEIVANGQRGDLHHIFRDEQVASVITIGHGALSHLYLVPYIEGEDEEYRYDWLDVSEQADHLKTGTFVQRQCGHRSRQFSLPLGTFAMQRHNQVLAAIGRNFNPKSLEDPKNNWLVPVTDMDRLSYPEARRQFQYQEPTSERMNVTLSYLAARA